LSTRRLLEACALLLFVTGLLLLFVPGELLRLYGPPAPPLTLHVAQLLAAALLGLGALDWLSRGMIIGGIYGRPVVVANMAATGIGALVLLRAALDDPGSVALWTAFAVAGAVASAFAWLLYRGGPPAPEAGPPA
jgi:hypothetical protein